MQLTPELSTIALENVAARMALILDEPHFQTQPPCSARSQCCTTEQILANDLASAAVSTAPVHAQEPAPITTPGTVTAATSLPHSFWIPGAANASKLTYWSTGPLNRPALSTGALFLPPGDPPEGGWPVISWAHGTVGISDQCAPTVTGTVGSPYLTNWLSQGYAIVATDYVGTRHAGNPRVPGRTVGGAQRDRHGACRACGRPWRYWLARWDG